MATYSDATLILIVQKAARRVNRKLKLTGTDNEITINSSNGEVSSPDDNDLKDIVLMQAECMIASREYADELRDATTGVSIVDGEQSIDTRGQAVARGTFFDSINSPCEELKEAIKMWRIDNFSGRLIY